MPFTYATAMSETSAGSSPNERTLMIGFLRVVVDVDDRVEVDVHAERPALPRRELARPLGEAASRLAPSAIARGRRVAPSTM